jgi:hypothetical protein
LQAGGESGEGGAKKTPRFGLRHLQALGERFDDFAGRHIDTLRA